MANKHSLKLTANALLRVGASRVAIGSLLLLPAMCMANGLTAEQRVYVQEQVQGNGIYAARNPAAVAVEEWQALTRPGQVADFGRISRFLLANPGWPREMELRRAAEGALDSNGLVPASAVEFFTRFAPVSASGHLRHALALRTANRNDDANVAARRAWTSGSLSGDDESRLLTFFPAALSTAEHDARMERLLWNNSTTAAARQLGYVSSSRRLEFEARLAMRTRATGAALRASAAESADPSLIRTNAGYIADKSIWLGASGQNEAARALLAGSRSLSAPPLETEKWLELLLAQARGAARDGQHRVAFDIASRIDDALPPGAAILDQSTGVRDEVTSLLWLAASTARQHLGRPGDAAALYARYAISGRSAQVQSRGLYWAGRAATDAGDTARANEYLTRAGRNIDQFYGQLSLERLGQPQPRPTLEGPIAISQAERQAFDDNSLVRAIYVLGQLSSWSDQSLFVRAVANSADTPAKRMMAAQLAEQVNRPDLNVWVGRSARMNGYPDYVPTAFPTVRVPVSLQSQWTFIHAISRQESSFDRSAVSHAGARGQMQLMPATAREQATRLGLGYDFNRLTTDTDYNMMLGSDYFRRMLDYFGGSYPLAVAAYNAGPGNVNRWLAANGDPRNGSIAILDWIEAIPISETRGYVQRVLENAVVYETMNPDRRVEARNILSRYLGKNQPG